MYVVQPLIEGVRVGHLPLADAEFTRVNYVDGTTVNALMDASTPIGPLAGQLMKLTANGLELAAESGVRPIGMVLFTMNEDAAYENSSAEATGNLAIITGPTTFLRVNLYETANYNKRNTVGSGEADLSYTPGDLLYCSENGLLTNEDEATGGFPVGLVIEAPDSENFMQVELYV